jgi:hypothetical protein
MPTWNDINETPDLRAEHNIRGMRSWAIQSQYSASPRMLRLMAAMQDALDLSRVTDDFYRQCFNLLTAEGVGLDNWGRILNIRRTITGQSGVSLTLEDEPYRLLLLYKAMANIASGEVEALNRLLKALCDTGVGGLPKVGYVLEAGKMVVRWVFEDYLTDVQLAVFQAAGTLARPAGVGYEWYFVHPGQVFGFDGSGLHPFNQAPFRPDDSLRVSTGDGYDTA